MKHLKKINEDFNGYDDFDDFDQISPEQAYKRVEDQLKDLPDSNDIEDEVDSLFDFIKEDGLDPYEMTFDDFYKWSSEHFSLESPKSFYKTFFKDKLYQKNPNQLELPFKESKKIKSFNQ